VGARLLALYRPCRPLPHRAPSSSMHTLSVPHGSPRPPRPETKSEELRRPVRPRHLHAQVLSDTGAVAARLRGRRVLELGCGTGLLSLVLARAGARVVASDYDAGALALIAQATPPPDTAPPRCDAFAGPRPGTPPPRHARPCPQAASAQGVPVECRHFDVCGAAALPGPVDVVLAVDMLCIAPRSSNHRPTPDSRYIGTSPLHEPPWSQTPTSSRRRWRRVYSRRSGRGR
jgi:SAM-dependent methyltransferase